MKLLIHTCSILSRYAYLIEFKFNRLTTVFILYALENCRYVKLTPTSTCISEKTKYVARAPQLYVYIDLFAFEFISRKSCIETCFEYNIHKSDVDLRSKKIFHQEFFGHTLFMSKNFIYYWWQFSVFVCLILCFYLLDV